jgi:hypothetical protein
MAATFQRQGSVLPLGDHTLQVIRVTLTAVTSGDITAADHGLSNIIFAASVNQSTADDAGLCTANVDSSSVAAVGTVGLSSFTSGDVVDVLILGN